MSAHKNVQAALAAAQSEMGPLIKGSVNPHFRSKYAELADVVEAIRAPFGNHGLSYYHTIEPVEDLGGACLTTVLCHGESGTEIRCPVPLIVSKQDMQAFKSATTYAKRIGLESVSGLAPEDDDGNAAAKAAPKVEARPEPQPKSKAMSRESYATLVKDMRAQPTAEDLRSWWSDPDVIEARKMLPADWRKELADECAKLGKVLTAQEEDSIEFA
jgi:hypothetical protein